MTTETVDPSLLNVTQKLRDSLPVDDLLDWLISEHPQAPAEQILAMLKAIYQEPFTITPAADETKIYRVGEREIDAYPQRVRA